MTVVADRADTKIPDDPVKESHKEQSILISQYSIHNDTPLGLGCSTDNQCVVEVRDRLTDAFYVAKPIRGGYAKDREIKFLKMLKEDNSQYIANLIAVTDDHIIMENGGTNLKRMIEVTGLPEKEMVRHYIAQLIKALCYLSEKGIVHGDIKPDNLLLRNGQLKVCDFGIARKQGENYRGRTPVNYTPPECFTHGESENMDIWSGGCVWYFLITGQKLFPRDFIVCSDGTLKVAWQKMIERIEGAANIIETQLGADAKGLFVKMMVLSSRHRITPEKAVQHPYIKAAELAPVKFPPVKDSLPGNAVSAADTGQYIAENLIKGLEQGYVKVPEFYRDKAGFFPARVSTSGRTIAGFEVGGLFPGIVYDNKEYMDNSRLLRQRSYDIPEYINVGTG